MATYTTELEAVNTMLRYLGETPVNSITSGSLPLSATLATTVLADISREVQSEGWHFNTAPKVTLSPNVSTKEIVVATDVIKADPNDITKDYVLRGTKLFDRANNTYQFDNDIIVNTTSLLDWDLLPQTARRYITLKAARVLIAQMVGSRELQALIARDEFNARADLMENDSGSSDRTIFDNYDTASRIGINRNYDIT
jgi:hypothetical protein